MDVIELEVELEALMADQRLVELCELHRTGDGVFDVISLVENQHSAMLSWMLDPKEGHGQGDEIVRDLLSHASAIVSSGASSLDGRATTARFFSDWTPSKIRTSSFASSFTAKELGLTGSERIDLFVVDPQNKFIVVIENKAGSKHSEDQLERYRREISSSLNSNSRLSSFDPIFIALDYYFDPDANTKRAAGKYWLHMGYDWLETTAVRAQAHVARGNSAAKLVASYCQTMTEWESAKAERVLSLAADLHQAYPAAVRKLVEYKGQRLETEWLENTDWNGAYLLFCLQNKSVIGTLAETAGMESVRNMLINSVKGLSQQTVEKIGGRINVCPTGFETLGLDGNWPVYLRVKAVNKALTKFSLTLCWRATEARTPEDAVWLRKMASSIDDRFNKNQTSLSRRVVVASGLSFGELAMRIGGLNQKLSEALQSAPSPH